MSQPDYPLATSTWGREELAAAWDVLSSGRTTMGAKTAEFEERFADYIGTRYAVMVNSGSSANLLMIAALTYTGQLRPGARVAVPAVAWSTTIAPLQQFGLVPVLVDVDDSLNIDPNKIPTDVAAILAVNCLGNSCDYQRFPSGPMVLEDNCEALGAVYDGVHTGAIGVMASHSLFFSHHINTMEGGVITTDDEELWRMLLMLRSHGFTRDLPEHVPGFESSFEFRVPGFNVRPTEVQAAIGTVQLERLPGFIRQRRANGAQYQEILSQQREIGMSSWFGFAVFAADRAGALAALEGVEVRPILSGNIQRQEMMRFFVDSVPIDYPVPGSPEPWAEPLLPMADRVHDYGFYVGNHHRSERVRETLERVASVLRRQADAA